METDKELFWQVYDEYIETKNEKLIFELSKLLEKVEKNSVEKQLLRPEKGWNQILGWQVLRNETMSDPKAKKFWFLRGEVILFLLHWDRDVFVSRIPIEEFVCGYFVRPKHDDEDFNGKGLYLPLYRKEDIIFFSNRFISKQKKNMLTKIEKELD